MSEPQRFIAKRDPKDPRGAIVKDNKIGVAVGIFPPDARYPQMPLRYAQVAAEAFNREHAKHLKRPLQRRKSK